MPTLILLTILISPQEEFDKAAERIRFPKEEMAAWSKRGDVERRVIAEISNRKTWAAALKQIKTRLGFEVDRCKVKVELYEADGNTPAQGGGRFGRGIVRFNMRRLVEYRKELDAAEEKKELGVGVRWIVPPMPFQAILTHELSHVFCGTLEEKWVSEGLATYVTEDTSLMHAFAQDEKKVGTVEGAIGKIEAYARGAAFITWLEDRAGTEGVHDFVRRVTRKGESTQTAATAVASMDWPRLLLSEQEWSKKWLAGFRKSER